MRAFWTAICSMIFATLCSAQEAPSQFVTEEVYDSPFGVTALEFDPAGRMLAAEKRGRIVIFQPDGAGGFTTPPTEFATLSNVASGSESGLLGMALDENYATNRYIYLCYTTGNPTYDQRITRITANVDFSAMVPGSELVLLGGLPRTAGNHKAGDVHVNPLDPQALYVAIGDDTHPENTQLVTRYEGKFLRIRKSDGRGFADNPFSDGNVDSVASRVWARGLRNPFRFTFHAGAPSTSVLYSSENSSGEFDRLSRVEIGSNGGWNGSYDSSYTNPVDTRHRVLAQVRPSAVGVAISPSGPFGTNVLYWGRVDGAGGAIHRYRLQGSNLDSAQPVEAGAFVSGEQSTIDLSFGPDGALYGSSSGFDASPGSWPIRRIRHLGSAPPVASFETAPSPATGEAPLDVQFTDRSTAPGSTIVARAWTFGDGESSTLANPAHRYALPGVYEARLRVTSASGQTATTFASVRVLRTTQVELSATVFDATQPVPVALSVPTDLRFYEADGTTPLPFASGTGTAGNVLPVPAGGMVATTVTLPLTGDSFVLSAGETASDGMLPATRGFAIGPGTQRVSASFYLSHTMISGRLLDTAGSPVAADVGLRRLGTPYAVPGGRDYLPGAGPASGVPHRLQADALGRFAFPVRDSDAGVEFQIDAVADMLTATFAPVSVAQAVPENGAQQLTLVTGRWSGGQDCDDLSLIPVTPLVDFATRIQRDIFEADCTGCHHAGATNSGGLDLTASGSIADLVARASTFAPGVSRVQPGNAVRSFLMEKVGCDVPQIGSRMRPGVRMPTANQALLRDWINQLGSVERVFSSGFE